MIGNTFLIVKQTDILFIERLFQIQIIIAELMLYIRMPLPFNESFKFM